MIHGRGDSPLFMTLLLIAGLILPQYSAFSQVIVTHKGYLSCYRRAQDLVMRNESIADHLRQLEKQKLAPPVQPDTPGWLFSSEQLDPQIAARLERLIVAACIEVYPVARKELKGAPDLKRLLDDVLAVEFKMRAAGFLQPVMEMVVMVTILNQDSQLAETLGPILFHETRSAFLTQMGKLPLPSEEMVTFRGILSTPLNVLRFTPGGPFAKFSAAVRGQQDLHVHLRKFDARQFTSMVIHESCHLNPRAAALRLKDWEDLTAAEWVFLTLQEEFRATYLTARLEEAWYNCAASTICDRTAYPFFQNTSDIVKSFEAFVSNLFYVHKSQERAVTAELARLRLLTKAAQEAILEQWVIWP